MFVMVYLKSFDKLTVHTVQLAWNTEKLRITQDECGTVGSCGKKHTGCIY